MNLDFIDVTWWFWIFEPCSLNQERRETYWTIRNSRQYFASRHQRQLLFSFEFHYVSIGECQAKTKMPERTKHTELSVPEDQYDQFIVVYHARYETALLYYICHQSIINFHFVLFNIHSSCNRNTIIKHFHGFYLSQRPETHKTK